MEYKAINFTEKFSLFDQQWKPKVIAEMNDYQFKLVKIQSEFVWHKHQDTDETFIVIQGKMKIEFSDGAVVLTAGEMFVVPKGLEHKPSAVNEALVMVIEPKGVINTGEAKDTDLTAKNNIWI